MLEKVLACCEMSAELQHIHYTCLHQDTLKELSVQDYVHVLISEFERRVSDTQIFTLLQAVKSNS